MARVGLLEDNERISKLCATMLNYAGHDVIIYVDASACLHALSVPEPSWTSTLSRTAQDAPLPIDVLILDLHLPTLSGLDVLRLLRNDAHTRALPLIVCTATTASEINLALQIAPEAIVVPKPFKLQTLIDALAAALTGLEQQS